MDKQPDIIPGEFAKRFRWDAFKWKWRMKVGNWLLHYVAPADELARLEKLDYVAGARNPKPRLCQEEVDSLTKYHTDVQDIEYRKKYFADTPLEETLQGQVLPLIEQVTKDDPSVKSFLNIGCFYAHIDHHLAERYPEINFTGVDFPANLREFNAAFERPNLSFHPGYALDKLAAGEVRGDMAMFSSAANTIRNMEVNEYIRLLKESGSKYILFNEPIYRMPAGRFVDPGTLHPHVSQVVFTVPVYLSDQPGPICRVHNYRGMLELAGYEIIHERVFKPGSFDLLLHQVLGRLKEAPAEAPAAATQAEAAPPEGEATP